MPSRALVRNNLSILKGTAIRGILAVVATIFPFPANVSCIVKQAKHEKVVEIMGEREKVAKIKAGKLEKRDEINPYGASPPPGEAITKAEIKAVDSAGKERMDDAIICLARTIYWEARGTDKTVMHAIANVVMNRLGHEGFPNTICGIVKQGRGEHSCQFSWWCDGLPDSAQEEKSYEAAKEIARKALNRQLNDLTGGALYFYSKGVTPAWSKKYVRTARIGTFEFYRPSGEKAK
jgi:spore germination cell wall hydrolase CwlJ-like protein